MSVTSSGLTALPLIDTGVSGSPAFTIGLVVGSFVTCDNPFGLFGSSYLCLPILK